jgi:hypothetical protein
MAYDEDTKSCTTRNHVTLIMRERSIYINSEAVQHDGHAHPEKWGMWLCRGNNIAMEGSDKDHNLIVRCIISVRVLGVGLLNVKIGH